jgi:hypothetical protein
VQGEASGGSTQVLPNTRFQRSTIEHLFGARTRVNTNGSRSVTYCDLVSYDDGGTALADDACEQRYEGPRLIRGLDGPSKEGSDVGTN